METLLEEVRNMYQGAADVLEHVGFRSNTELRWLSREDLHELFPGVENLQLRKKLFETIHKLGAEEELLRDLAEKMHGGLQTAINSPEYWAEYIGFVQKVKKQMYIVEECLGYKIDVTNNHPYKPLPEATKEKCWTVNLKSKVVPAKACIPEVTSPKVSKLNDSINMSTTNDSSAGKIHITVKYKMVVSGQTFGAHNQLMKRVEGSDEQRVSLVESPDESQITIVFCPICSRIESDVDAAMAGVTDDKPVILVLMFHKTEAQSAMCRLRPVERPNIVLQVAVFYHQTQNGLLGCQENRAALSRVRSEFLKHGETEPFEDLTEYAANMPNEAPRATEQFDQLDF